MSNKIIIDVTETTATMTSGKNGIVSVSGSGKLTVKNPTSKSLLWNLALKNDNTFNTNLPAEASREKLEAGQDWVTEYTLENLNTPILRFNEVVDTSLKTPNVNEYFVKDTAETSNIVLTLENITDKDITEIVLKKKIPDFFKHIKVLECSGGEPKLDIEANYLEWIIPSIAPGDKQKAIIQGNVMVSDSSEKHTEPVDISFISKMNQRTEYKPSIRALTDTMTSTDKEEAEGKSNSWNCEVELENESEFEITLDAMKVNCPDMVGKEVVVDIEPNAVIAAEDIWSHKFSLDMAQVPTIQPNLVFTANHEVVTKIVSTIKKEASVFPVLETKSKKIISPPTVNANSNTDMQITNVIENVGTASIDVMSITDVLPTHFEPPSFDQIKLSVHNTISDSSTPLSDSQINIVITPDNKESTSEHTVQVDLKEIGSLLGQKCNLVMEYPLIARNPQASGTYNYPLDIKSVGFDQGGVYADKPAELPVIGIQATQRKIKTAKSIRPGSEGSFRVSIRVDNKGDVELENVSVIEVLPKGFTAEGFVPDDNKPEFKEEIDGSSKLIWNFAQIVGGKRIKLEYEVKGEGEFPRTEPEVVIAETSSIKTAKASVTMGLSGQSDSADAGKVPAVDGKDIHILTGIYGELITELNKFISNEAAGKLIEDTRDKLIEKGKARTLVNEFTATANELKELGDKTLVGESLDALLNKINVWKGKMGLVDGELKTVPLEAEAVEIPETAAPEAGAESESSGTIGVQRNKCPNCGSIKIQQEEDRSTVVSYVPKPIYAKKFVCTQCKFEFK